MKNPVITCTVKPLLFFTIILLIMAFAAQTESAPDQIDISREHGEIQGTVSYCGSSGPEGIQVYIPGKSFAVYVNPAGEFTLSYVPVGTWSLVFTRSGQKLGSLSDVTVEKRKLTDLNLTNGPVVLCDDLDGDGYDPSRDCDDGNPRIFPGAPDYCGDGLDNNCDGMADESCPECNDIDGDGFYAQMGCGLIDCSDNNPTINPGAAERCDGVDNDCDTIIDEADAGDALTFYLDSDHDGFGDPSHTVTACTPPDGYTLSGGDCDNNNNYIYPGAPEICNEVDDDCDGFVDNECSNRVCSNQETLEFEACLSQNNGNPLVCFDVVSMECKAAIMDLLQCGYSFGCSLDNQTEGIICLFDNCPAEFESVFGNEAPVECADGETKSCGTNTGECSYGTQTCINGRWDSSCIGATYPAPEICDGLDNDCDGQSDNEPVDGTVFYVDFDGDGYGSEEVRACEQPQGAVLTGGDCNDENPEVHPGQTMFFEYEENTDVRFDYNCDGTEEVQSPSLASWDSPPICDNFVEGWLDFVPVCGQSGTFVLSISSCSPDIVEARKQACR